MDKNGNNSLPPQGVINIVGNTSAGLGAGFEDSTATVVTTASTANISAPLTSFIPPFIQSLAGALRLKGSRTSARHIMQQLPGGFAPPTVEECLQAAERAGTFARISARAKILDIPLPTLPCVLVLDSNSKGERKSCILLAIEPVHEPVSETEIEHLAPKADEQNFAGHKPVEPHNTTNFSEPVSSNSAKAVSDTPEKRFIAKVIFPENDPELTRVPLAELEALYSGYAVFLPQPEAPTDKRVEGLQLSKPRHWFWGALRQFAPVYVDVAIASLVVNILGLAGPLFVMNVYDRVVPNNAVYTMWMLVAGLLIAYGVDFILRNLRSHFVDTAGRGADVIIGSKLMERVLHMRLQDKPESVGGMVNNLREFEQVRDFFGSTTLLALFDLPFLLIYMLAVALIGGPIVVLLIFSLPLMLLFVALVQAPFKRSVERQFKQNMQKNSLLVEMIGGLETIKSILAQGQIKRRWETVVNAYATESARSRGLASLAQTGTLLMTLVLNAAVIVWGVYRIADNSMTQGGLIACVILVGRALGPFAQLAQTITNLQRAKIALRALEQIVTLPMEEEHASGSTAGLTAELSFTHVTFRYPHSSHNVLRDISFKVSPGEKIGVIGATGSGKSTLGRLLTGLYEPQDGSVSFGGVDVRQLDKTDLRTSVGYMPQENYLFYGSVRENIAMGCPCLDMKSMVQAAHVAGVDEFVAKTPAGYDLQVGERGSALSGGQRQAIALARTLVRSPNVLVLDEPSSNLDMHGEHQLMLRLQSVVKDKTLVVMTHRPSLLALVDRIIVLHEGAIVADGPRDAIIQAMNNGLTVGR